MKNDKNLLKTEVSPYEVKYEYLIIFGKLINLLNTPVF